MLYEEIPIEDAVEITQRVICPDELHYCPDGTTCCKRHDGSYGCCPYPDAVCCKDNSCCPHAMTCCQPYGCCPIPNAVCCKDGPGCCPHGTQCDIEHHLCIESHFLPMLMGLPEVNNMEKVQSCA